MTPDELLAAKGPRYDVALVMVADLAHEVATRWLHKRETVHSDAVLQRLADAESYIETAKAREGFERAEGKRR